MILKKYMTKHLLMRLCLMLALIGAAAVFDMYHAANQKLSEKIRKIPVPDEAENQKIYICPQVTSYNLKTPATEFSIRFKYACSEDKFLLKHYNLRTFQIMKAESVQSSFPMICSFHSLPFNRVLYSSPDDTPPVS